MKSAIIFALMVVIIAFGWTVMKGISPNCPPYFDPERTGIVWQCIPHHAYPVVAQSGAGLDDGP